MSAGKDPNAVKDGCMTGIGILLMIVFVFLVLFGDGCALYDLMRLIL